jgi:hypothetical protein
MPSKGFTELKNSEDFIAWALLLVLGLFFLTGLWYVLIKGIAG